MIPQLASTSAYTLYLSSPPFRRICEKTSSETSFFEAGSSSAKVMSSEKFAWFFDQRYFNLCSSILVGILAR